MESHLFARPVDAAIGQRRSFLCAAVPQAIVETVIGKTRSFCGLAKLCELRCLACSDAPDMVGETVRIVSAGQPCLVVEAVGVIAARLSLAA